MRKQLIALALAFALAVLVIACGRNTGTTGYMEPAMEGSTTTEATSDFPAESALQTAESESATQAEAAAPFSAGTTAQAVATSTTPSASTARPAAAQPVPAVAPQVTARTVKPATQPTTRNMAPTTTTTAAPVALPAVQPPKPVYTTDDYAEIIAAVRQYAENKSKVKFVWDTSLTMANAGFHGTPNLTRHGTASVLDDLKYHCDLTEEAVSGGNGGVPSSEVHYNVYWFVDQNNIWAAGNGDILFVLVYG